MMSALSSPRAPSVRVDTACFSEINSAERLYNAGFTRPSHALHSFWLSASLKKGSFVNYVVCNTSACSDLSKRSIFDLNAF